MFWDFSFCFSIIFFLISFVEHQYTEHLQLVKCVGKFNMHETENITALGMVHGHTYPIP